MTKLSNIETAEEKAGRQELVKALGPHWHNMSATDVRKESEEAVKKYREMRGTAYAAKREAATALYKVYLFHAARNTVAQLMELYRQTNKIRFKATTHPLAAIVRAEYKDDADVAYLWSGALRYALVKRIAPQDLAEFLEDHGGFQKCCDRFVALSGVKRTKPVSEVITRNFDGLAIALSRKMRRKLREKIKKHGDHTFKIVAQIANKRLILKSVRTHSGREASENP